MSGYNPIKNLFAVTSLLKGTSILPQNPTGLGLAGSIQVEFGPAQLSLDRNVSLNAAGEITLLHSVRKYQLAVTLRAGRNMTNLEAYIHGWLEFKLPFGQYLPVPASTLSVTEIANASIREATRFLYTRRDVPVGTKFRIKIARGEDGVDDGGLIAHIPIGTLGFLDPAPSAEVQVLTVDSEARYE